LDGLADLPVEEHTLFSMRSARTFLDCGYTSCVGAASAKQRLDLVIRNAIQAGDIAGPRYLANGKEMAPNDGALIVGITEFIETPDEARKAVQRYAEEGLDSIKLSMSGEEITETLRAEDKTIPDDIVAAAVDEAHIHGLRVCSHARSDESIVQCLQYGVDIIYHACEFETGAGFLKLTCSFHLGRNNVCLGTAER
jgi:imidazolonepropionase-like amidohydrolase